MPCFATSVQFNYPLVAMAMRSRLSEIYVLFVITVNRTTAQYRGQVTFTLAEAKTFTHLHIIGFGWNEVQNLPACAFKTHHESSNPLGTLGFLYDKNERLCTPVIGFGESGSARSSEVIDGESQLYLFRKDCPVGYQLFQTEDGKTCLRVSNYTSTYQVATKTCRSWGGHLVAVKTLTKLDLVKKVSNHASVWIGLDDIAVEDHFVWQSDGSALTVDQRSELFDRKEPNNSFGNEDCIYFWWLTPARDLGLNDETCDRAYYFICEAIHH